MKTLINLKVMVIIILLLYSNTEAKQPNVVVNDLMSNPTQMIDRLVTIEGVVVRHVEEDRDYKTYQLEDRFGQRIFIRTISALPETNKRIKVTGVFQDSNNARYINEIKRVNQSGFSFNRNLLIVMGIVLLFGLITIVFVFSSKKPKPKPFPPVPPIDPNRDAKKHSEFPYKDYDSKTVILLKGQFHVLSGIDSPKIINFQVSPDKKINEFTFGRSAGDKETHIQLKSDAVSRIQAKLITSNDRYTLINYSDSNPTSVNDKTLEPNESIEIRNGDIVSMADVVLKFVKK